MSLPRGPAGSIRRARQREQENQAWLIQIGALITWHIELKLKEQCLKPTDHDRLDLADRIMGELKKYYGRASEQRLFTPSEFASYEAGRLKFIKPVKTGIWYWIKEKSGW